MLQTAAARRYNRRFIPTFVVYAVLLTGATWIAKHFDPSGPALVALALLPTVAIVGSLMVMGRYLLEETDEYVKQQAVTAMLFSVAILLSLSTALGFLQQRNFLGSIDLLWAFPIWCVVYGFAQMWLIWRDCRAEPEA